MSGPLTGLTVLEFSQIYAGPFAGMLLADMGADVIKVEPTWGEPWRYVEEFAPGENRAFISLNRGKRSLPLDLTTPEGRRIVHRLAESADVVVINARSDVPAALGIDYGTLSSINPGIVYCDNSAFGQTGPGSHQARLRHRRPGGYRHHGLRGQAGQRRSPADRVHASRRFRRGVHHGDVGLRRPLPPGAHGQGSEDRD